MYLPRVATGLIRLPKNYSKTRRREPAGFRMHPDCPCCRMSRARSRAPRRQSGRHRNCVSVSVFGGVKQADQQLDLSRFLFPEPRKVAEEGFASGTNLRLACWLEGYEDAAKGMVPCSVELCEAKNSSNADNCATGKRITPSSIFGQRKTPCSNRSANRHRPASSQKKISLSCPLAWSEHIDRFQERISRHGPVIVRRCRRKLSPSGGLWLAGRFLWPRR